MNDETTTDSVDAAQREAAGGPDPFEIKWKKKNEPAPATKTPETRTAGPETAVSETVESLKAELEAERERVRTLQDRWQRAAADLANLRRRTEQEREEVEKFASLLLVQELLPVLDNFERALSTIPGNLAMLTWIQGVMLVERHFRAVLERTGLTVLEVTGKTFSPHEAEAVSERETSEVPAGTIIQEYQRGYSMHGRVIRPALVEVAAAQTAAAETSPAEPEVIAHEAETQNAGP
jgi:molecular chaperone GrpE